MLKDGGIVLYDSGVCDVMQQHYVFLSELLGVVLLVLPKDCTLWYTF